MPRADIISIIGGGWSAGLVDLNSIPGHVVAVNNAAFYAPRVDTVMSMDRKWSEFRWPWMLENGQAGKFDVWLRRTATKNIRGEFPWLHRFSNDHLRADFSDEPEWLNGTNSGGCALAHAYAQKPGKIYLFGFDLRPGPKGEGHWYGKGEPRGIAEVGSAPVHAARYAGWAKEYERPAEQFKGAGIQVVNVSDITLIKSFQRMSPKSFNAGAR